MKIKIIRGLFLIGSLSFNALLGNAFSVSAFAGDSVNALIIYGTPGIDSVTAIPTGKPGEVEIMINADYNGCAMKNPAFVVNHSFQGDTMVIELNTALTPTQMNMIGGCHSLERIFVTVDAGALNLGLVNSVTVNGNSYSVSWPTRQ